ncbi:reverse transcriptase domain, reverse transcriptase zinc-binding domain protein [Tanacetum coccineum]
MAQWMRCSVGELPFTYLGLPIGQCMKRSNAWRPVIEKFKKRLCDWKAKTMSFGGRLTLVKSVLGSLPLYYFLMFRVPLSVIKSLELICKDFFWAGVGDGKKLSWVKWDTIISSYGKERGAGGEKGRWGDNGWVWEWDWAREPTGRVYGELEELISILQNVLISIDSIKGKLPVRVELDKRGIDLDTILCPCCSDIVESCDHSMILCNMAMSVWEKIFSWWKLGMVDAFNVRDKFSHNGRVEEQEKSHLSGNCGYLIRFGQLGIVCVCHLGLYVLVFKDVWHMGLRSLLGKEEEVNDAQSECGEKINVKGGGNGSTSSGHFKMSEVPRSGGSMLGLLEEVVKVGQVMGFNMKGCISNMEDIIGSQGVDEGDR